MSHNGIKKSQFTLQDVISAGATFDFVYNNTNYKIPVADMIAAFGTTGSLIQKGDPAQTPILNAVGTVNQIRNLEDGSGVKASISPLGGALLDHNFRQDSVGSQILKDITAASPTVRTLVAGNGISIAIQNGSIQIAMSATPTSTKTIIVDELSDLPTPVSNVITLIDDTNYHFVDDVALGINRLVMGANSLISAVDDNLILLSYTGIGTMLTSNNVSFRVEDIKLECAAGQLMDVSCSANESLVQFIDCTVSECDTVGSINGVFLINFEKVSFDDIKTNGMLLTGFNTVLNMATSTANINGGTLIDLGTSTTLAVSIATSFATAAAGTTVLAGLPDSGNIIEGGLGVVFNVRGAGDGASLSGITPNDNLWQFLLNSSIPDTRENGMVSLNSNTTETVIAVATTPVLIAGTWAVELENKFEASAAGRLTYKGPKDIVLPVSATITGAPVSGTNIAIEYHLYKNGLAVPRATQGNIISSGSPKNTSIIWELTLSTDEYIELFVSNDTNTTNVLVTDAVDRIN